MIIKVPLCCDSCSLLIATILEEKMQPRTLSTVFILGLPDDEKTTETGHLVELHCGTKKGPFLKYGNALRSRTSMNHPAVLKDSRACKIYNDKSGRWPIGFPNS